LLFASKFDLYTALVYDFNMEYCTVLANIFEVF